MKHIFILTALISLGVVCLVGPITFRCYQLETELQEAAEAEVLLSSSIAKLQAVVKAMQMQELEWWQEPGMEPILSKDGNLLIYRQDFPRHGVSRIVFQPADPSNVVDYTPRQLAELIEP